MSGARIVPYFGKFQPQMFIRSDKQLDGEKRDILCDFKNIRDMEFDSRLMISGKVRFILTGNFKDVDDKQIFDITNDEVHKHQLIGIWWKKPEIGFCKENLKDFPVRTWQEVSHSGNSGYDYIILPIDIDQIFM